MAVQETTFRSGIPSSTFRASSSAAHRTAPHVHDQQPRRQVQRRAVPRGHNARVHLPPLPERPPLDARGDRGVIVVESRGAAPREYRRPGSGAAREADRRIREPAETARGRKHSERGVVSESAGARARAFHRVLARTPQPPASSRPASRPHH
jgi:hypothetical protein